MRNKKRNKILRIENPKQTISRLLRYALLLFSLCTLNGLMLPVQAEDTEFELLERSIEIQSRTNTASRQSQRQIDTLSDESKILLDRYQSLMRQADFQEAYREEMRRQLDQQYLTKARLHQQIEQLAFTQRHLLPLLRQMLDSLEQFVQLDLPFLLEERHKRLTNLRDKLEKADLPLPQKLDAVMEAYQIENDYGRSIEAYQDKLRTDDNERMVEFLRIGRVALYYQTSDGLETGIWDASSNSWQHLSTDYRSAIRQGLRVAKKRVAPKLLTLPITAHKEAL